jgi:DNA repair exonuclease SbcCD ATPase subunit
MDPSQTITLNRLLGRLEHTLLSADADPKLRYSQYERNRVGVNVENARSLLLSLEKQSASVRSQLSQKQSIQADLQQKRELVKQLNAKLEELNRLGEEEENVDSESDEDDEAEESNSSNTQQPSYAPARMDADNGLEANVDPRETLRTAVSDAQQQANQQEMRSRKPLSAADNRSAASTTAREELFAGRKQHPDLETTEALMSHNRSEQDALTNGLLGLARALKESTMNFGASLEAEKDVMKRAESSLEKSSLGMEAAGAKMGTLRRMSEGQGWWGRIKLYGCIFALWVFLFLVVFLGPKLRF